MTKPGLCTLLLCIALAGPLAAQEGGQQSEEDEERGISGRAALGYLATSGNTDSTNANASFELLYERLVWSHEFALSAISASRDDVTTAESYTGAYAARRSFGERSYLFTALDWRSDRFSAFDHQASETVGYGRRLVDTERHALSVEGGLGARQAERQTGVQEDDQIARFKLDYTLTVNGTTEFSQDLVAESGDANTSIESVSALRARLFGDIALVISHRIRRNSDVDPGIEKTDQFSSISLEYAF